MFVFHDSTGGRVELTFGKNRFEMPARHVLVVLKHKGKWLLTKHRTRGIEFPGGKAEKEETMEEAAIRETFEETGITIFNVQQFAEYVVQSNITFCKAVFTGEIAEIDLNPTLHETEGAVWMTDEELDTCDILSFHMIDTGMDKLREWVEANERQCDD